MIHPQWHSNQINPNQFDSRVSRASSNKINYDCSLFWKLEFHYRFSSAFHEIESIEKFGFENPFVCIYFQILIEIRNLYCYIFRACEQQTFWKKLTLFSQFAIDFNCCLLMSIKRKTESITRCKYLWLLLLIDQNELEHIFWKVKWILICAWTPATNILNLIRVNRQWRKFWWATVSYSYWPLMLLRSSFFVLHALFR